MPNTASVDIFANLSNTDKIVVVFREAAKQLMYGMIDPNIDIRITNYLQQRLMVWPQFATTSL